MIRTRSFSRVGFLGNPSDGYYGKTVSVALDAIGCTTIKPTIPVSDEAESQTSGIWRNS